jgi:tetratricopeptide (TPR) repeat protein
LTPPRIPFLFLLASLAACGGAEDVLPPVAAPREAPAPPSEEAKQAFYRGKELYQEGDPVAALDEMRRAVVLAPDWHEAEFALGKLLLSLSFVRFGTATKEHTLLAEAKVALARAVELRPDHVESLYWQARGFYVAREWAAAEPAYRRVLAREPGHRLATRELGLVHEEAGEPEKAREILLRAREIDRFDDEVRFHLAMALLDLDDLAGAKAEFLAALALNPAHPGPRTALVTLCQRLGESEESDLHAAELERYKPLRQRLTAALEQATARPRDPEALFTTAQVYREIGMPIAALTWAERVLTLAPEHEGARTMREALATAAEERDAVAR